jgi:hypothetical protein
MIHGQTELVSIEEHPTALHVGETNDNHLGQGSFQTQNDTRTATV